MTGKYILTIIANAIVTFGITTIPLFAASVFLLESSPRTADRIMKRFLFLGINVNLFLLFLLSIYGKTSIISIFLYLCEKMHVKFLLAALIVELFIIVILKCKLVSIRHCKTYISKPISLPLFVALFLIMGSFRFKEMYGMVPVEQLIFHIMLPRSGANLGIVYKIIIRTIIDSIIIFVLLASLLFVEMNFKKKNFYFNIKRKHQWMAVVFLLVSGICFSVVNMGVPSYVTELQKEPSMFYEENYIDPNSIEITFPEKKRNLIVIFIESLETGFLTREEGGAFSERLIPEIEDLMKNNINFSASGGFGGAFQLDGTGWTIAGITAQYSGVPLVLGHLVINNYGILGDFLSGASGVGDILYKAGYKNYFILGSEIEFGGRDKYFKMHKNTVIYDYRYFLYNNYIPRNYKVWWGFEDRKLYGFAKEKILEAAKDEPFFVTILTADTHGPDGYLDKYALRMFDSRYKNVLFDMNSQLIHFLEWLKEQGFYENTTVVVLGDHLFMDASIYPKDFVHNSYNRFPVNIFINSLLSKINTKNRFFSHFDIFPALIDSIGGVYNARGLALGRSMNKGEPTLLEKYGVDNVNNILQQKSDYYNGLWGMK